MHFFQSSTGIDDGALITKNLAEQVKLTKLKNKANNYKWQRVIIIGYIIKLTDILPLISATHSSSLSLHKLLYG